MSAVVQPSDVDLDRAPTRLGSHIGPRLAAASLVVGAGLNTAQAVLSQLGGGRPDDVTEQIAFANDQTGLFLAMCVVGTVAVPFMALGFVAAAQELARRSRIVAYIAGSLLVLGMWGFLAVQTAELIQFTTMLDPEGHSAATYLDRLDESVVLNVVFGIWFFAGTVLGMLVLTIAMLVRGGVPRWIPGAWLAFIVLDFSIGGVGPVDPHWLYFAGAVGLAAHLLRGRVAPRA
jgi:hypothetical protein